MICGTVAKCESARESRDQAFPATLLLYYSTQLTPRPSNILVLDLPTAPALSQPLPELPCSIISHTSTPIISTLFGLTATMEHDQIFSPTKIQGLIAAGRVITITEGRVLQLDGWLDKHPGGRLAVLHMVGRDATDEINV